jgi:broad specificity phosphatase PhoE
MLMGAIYLLRHGQASFGAANYDQLSPTGHAQAQVLGQALRARGVQPEHVVCGSMQRHVETAQGALAAWADVPELTLPQTVTHAGVNEFDHENVIEVAQPRYADKAQMMVDMAATADPRRAFQKFFQDAVSRWVGGNHDDEYKEPWSVFKLRCVAALEDLVRQTPPKGTTLVFTSGGTISVICAHLLGLNDAQAFTINWTLANAGITKIQAGRDGLHLISVNEHAHVEGAQPPMLTYR